ncbi:MAG: hypothetical protein IJ313_02520 [Clostridia bacterium]|nr:hypothetical protein [Clostridia bacterium]
MTKKKKKQTKKESAHLLTADDPSARDAALTEDAARSGDSEALKNFSVRDSSKVEERSDQPQIQGCSL